MKKLIVATRNKGKLKEIREILDNLDYEVVSMDEAGFAVDIEETGTTFEENALIKARTIYEATGEISLADDSGLEVDYLNGAPGIYSARFGGEGASDREKNDKLLDMLKNASMPERTARFVCVVAVVFPGGRSFTVRGECSGLIWTEPRGANGFGYDPVFYVPEYGMTIAEMDSALKNKISHRGKALALMAEKLKHETYEI